MGRSVNKVLFLLRKAKKRWSIDVMKVQPTRYLRLFLFLRFLVGISYVCGTIDVNRTQPYSEVFPSLENVVSMARLSHLVYKFRSNNNFTCDEHHPERISEGILCEWYIHDYVLGTQVLLVSNEKEKYIAVIFAGTDDIRTSLEDTNIVTKLYGNNSTVRLTNDINNEYIKAKVHGGFNNAVFTHGIWEQIYSKTQGLLRKHPSYSLWTTGHSLGAANSILTATAFALLNHNRKVRSVNFGCPQTGNNYWRVFFNSTSPLTENLGVWRVVLAWDLVPRLPELFYHVGHTIQLDAKSKDLKVYYEHYGDYLGGYAGVPVGWYSKSYAWLPYALYYHQMNKYLEYLEEIEPKSWIKAFQKTHPNVYDNKISTNLPDVWLMAEDKTT